jgi:hypothetical protein
VRGVLLDIDGTLVDSNDAHARAWTEACARHGHAVPAAAVRLLIGMGGDQLLPRVTGIDAESRKGKAITATRAMLFRHLLPTLRAFPDARELLFHMRRRGLRLVAASSATKDELTALKEKGVDPREVLRSVNGIETMFLNSLERVGGFGGVADQMNDYWMNAGDPDFFAEDLARYRAVEASDITAAAIRWLGPGRAVISVVPNGHKEMGVPATPGAPEGPADKEGGR